MSVTSQPTTFSDPLATFLVQDRSLGPKFSFHPRTSFVIPREPETDFCLLSLEEQEWFHCSQKIKDISPSIDAPKVGQLPRARSFLRVDDSTPSQTSQARCQSWVGISHHDSRNIRDELSPLKAQFRDSNPTLTVQNSRKPPTITFCKSPHVNSVTQDY